jgi:hypothetical protein
MKLLSLTAFTERTVRQIVGLWLSSLSENSGALKLMWSRVDVISMNMTYYQHLRHHHWLRHLSQFLNSESNPGGYIGQVSRKAPRPRHLVLGGGPRIAVRSALASPVVLSKEKPVAVQP